MQKYINYSMIYTILSLVSGVFYREFTKYLGFTEYTALSVTHVHLFALGTIVFLIITLFSVVTNITEHKSFKKFILFYNISLPLVVLFMYVRGITQVLEMDLTSGVNAAISGLAGLAHILFTVAIVFLFMSLKKSKPIRIQ